MAKNGIKKIKYKRKKLTADERIRMYVEHGGRCALCNRKLLEGGITAISVTFGEAAHIIGLQPDENSARSLDEDLTEDERNDPSNLMLICESDHAEIDKTGSAEMFPTEWLRQKKAGHLNRIDFLTGLNPKDPTVPLRVIAKVRGDYAEVNQTSVADAVMYSAMRYPKFRLSDRNEIEVDLRGLPGEQDATLGYYAAARDRIDEVFDHTLATGFAADDIAHLSVFAFARIPVLVYLGTKLGDHSPVDIYQRHRSTEDWVWPRRDGHLDFAVQVPPTSEDSDEAVLVINVSGTIQFNELPSEVTGLPILSITSAERHPDVVDSPTKLAAFTRACHELIGRIEADGYKTVDRLHVFIAAPLSCAVTLGRVFDPDTHPTLAIYDRQSGAGYRLGMEVGNR